MDKSWIDNDARHTKIYQQGVNNFIAFAFENSAVGSKIPCPCRKCVNSFWREGSEVREHLICDGFLKGYRTWTLHGEVSSSVNHENYDGVELMEETDEDDNISDLLRDLAAGLDDNGDFDDNSSDIEPCEELVAIQKCAPASSVRSVVGGSIDLHWECSATSPIKNVVPSKKNKAPRVSPDDLVGKEVTLYAMLRQEAVAKAVVISTNPSSVLGGQPLGRLFCEVVVKVVIKRDTVLPRPYGDIETLADAKSMPVQWPYKRMKLSNASHSSQPTAGGPAPTRF